MTQRIINLDSQVLNGISACARKAQYNFKLNIQPAFKAEALEKGSLMHLMFEIYDGLRGGCADFNSEVWKDLLLHDLSLGEDFMISYDNPPSKEKHELEQAKAIANSAGRYFAAKMELDVAECEEVFFQFNEYVEHYRHDGWETLAVESVASKVLYEDEELQIIYTGKIDKVAQKGNVLCPWDHKTSKKRTNTSLLSNQFMGYAWLMGSAHVLIDKIGFQKTLKPAERFQREIKTYTPDQILEWCENTVYWAKYWDHCVQYGQFPLNLTSCDKYSGCIYEPICSRDRASRDHVIDRDFKIGKKWDVAAELEGVKNEN